MRREGFRLTQEYVIKGDLFMFNLREYYENENEKIDEDYNTVLSRLREICDDTSDYQSAGEMKEHYRFINFMGNFLLKIANIEENLNDDYFSTGTFDELLDENNGLFADILHKNYKDRYANPTHSVELFGDDFGQLLSFFYTIIRRCIGYAHYHKRYKMYEYIELLIDVFDYIENDELDYNDLKMLVTRLSRTPKSRDIIHSLKEQFSVEFKYIRDIVESEDLNDLRYLFKYGKYISKNEVESARFLSTYPDKEIEKLSTQISKSYLRSFGRNGKDISKKNTIQVIYNIGQERIVRNLIEEFTNYGLYVLPSAVSTNPNRQYNYDHNFDNHLYLSEEFIKKALGENEKAYEFCKEDLCGFSGLVYFRIFGETPFNPENKRERLKLTTEQLGLYQKLVSEYSVMRERYVPRSETSFTIAGFPIPEIGERYEEIFRDTVRINTLDSIKYEKIQQNIIDVFDRADHIHIKGVDGNETDLKINLQEITNPDEQTNFLNSGAYTNIPVGELFTTPKLSGTEGTYHLIDVYIGGLRYSDLKLTFKDGYIADYSCSNFEDEEDNEEFIEENLLFPHKTLPMGEFAVGTNTLAYSIGKKYDIFSVLPTLITEKMGVHIAVGDNCFSREEGRPVFNSFNGKEVTARDNEKSALRKTNPDQAYTNVHTDITIPYESIEFVSAVMKDGEVVDVIRDGFFVLKRTEELNEPLRKISEEK